MYRLVYRIACRNLSSNTNGRGGTVDTNKQLRDLVHKGRVDKARRLFDEMPKRDGNTWNTMLAGYAHAGRVVEAGELLDGMPESGSITCWSALVEGYCKVGFENESFWLFYEMQHEGYKPNQFTLGSILRLCSVKGLLSRGEQVHGFAVKSGFDMDVFVVNGLIEFYAKCLHVSEAGFLFESMAEGKNHVTWTAMINGYSSNGDAVAALQCFAGMRGAGIEANQYTFPGVLNACVAVADHEFGSQVHGCVVRGGFSANVFVQSALVDMYSKSKDLRSARKVVESMERDNVVSWNAMIQGCLRQGMPQQALPFFKMMHAKGMELDDFTYPSIINSLALMKDVANGNTVHSLVVKSGFEHNRLVSNALIDMYAKHGNLDRAFKLFDLLMEKDVVSWTSLITGCARSGWHEEAIKFFCTMMTNGVKPDSIVASSALSSCAELALLNAGEQVHASSIKSGLSTTLSVNNSLVSLYAHCGCLENARALFNSMEVRNVITWTALIIGFAQNGEGSKSLEFYEEMLASGVKPDFITFIGVLFACSHVGLTERGYYYFKSMVRDHGITPGSDHYACMVDLLGRSGKIKEAAELLNEMTVKPDAAVWKSLLSACRKHGNLDLAKKAATELFELEPQDSVPYVMLANMYSSLGKWQEAASVRSLMKSLGISKEPGRSWMNIKSKLHSFISDDRAHPEAEAIFRKVDEMLMLIKEAGYTPDTSFVLHDINEEGKLHGLAYHSEKLAVALGILKLPVGAPIRIYKNIRVCGDCHTAMKFISQVYERHIILRDSNRFHHFKEGECSCGDYW